MKRNILTTRHLHAMFDEAHLPLGASIPKMLSILIDQDFEAGEEFSRFKINIRLLPLSYQTVPAMYARTINRTCKYEYIQSYLREGMLHLRAGHKRFPITFRARVLAALRKYRKFQVPRKLVPRTYRRRPSDLSARLANELATPVCNLCKADKIVWYLG